MQVRLGWGLELVGKRLREKGIHYNALERVEMDGESGDKIRHRLSLIGTV